MDEKKEYVNIFNWHHKSNILGEIIVLRSRCIYLCHKKCNLGQIPITSQVMSSEQLKCFPVSSITRSLGCWNPNHNQIPLVLGIIITCKKNYSPICQYFILTLPMVPNGRLLAMSFRIIFFKLAGLSNIKKKTISILALTFSPSNEAWYIIGMNKYDYLCIVLG